MNDLIQKIMDDMKTEQRLGEELRNALYADQSSDVDNAELIRGLRQHIQKLHRSLEADCRSLGEIDRYLHEVDGVQYRVSNHFMGDRSVPKWSFKATKMETDQ